MAGRLWRGRFFLSFGTWTITDGAAQSLERPALVELSRTIRAAALANYAGDGVGYAAFALREKVEGRVNGGSSRRSSTGCGRTARVPLPSPMTAIRADNPIRESMADHFRLLELAEIARAWDEKAARCRGVHAAVGPTIPTGRAAGPERRTRKPLPIVEIAASIVVVMVVVVAVLMLCRRLAVPRTA
jgi:hypothetical protein